VQRDDSGPVPETVLDAVRLLAADGYGTSITPATTVRCAQCGHEHALGELLAERVYRFEGPSDPDEEAIVVGVRCGECGMRGTIVSAYGPAADPDVILGLSMLESRFRS
jgi:hypothetical protein